MKDIYRDRLRREEILTVPNLLSFFRILLIPVIVVLYCVFEEYRWAVAVILLSALTDMVDGKIARHFHQISDFGKFIDPVADKLTEATLILCLVSRYSVLLVLLALLVVKDCAQFLLGLKLLKKENRMDSSQWFGKLNTAVLYAVLTVLFLFPEISAEIAYPLIALCFFCLILSAVGYGVFFYRSLHSSQ